MIFFAYIKFLLKSTNQHGVHSPFVYDLVTQCFYDKKKYPAYEKIWEYRNKLLQNNGKIKVTDFGAGSRVFSSEERKISAMAKNVGISPKRANLLNRLVYYLKIDHALELGTSLGISTSAMALGNDVQIITLEGCPQTAKVAEQQFEDFRLKNIVLKVGEFEGLLNDILEEKRRKKREKREKKRDKNGGIPNSLFTNPESLINEQHTDCHSREKLPRNDKQQTIKNKKQTFDLIFFDGNHQKDATLSYFNKLLPLATNDSVFIFDDIHWSKGMEEAWKEICAHPKVKISIDTFQWGLIFFRKEQEKQHFVIRM